MIQSRVSAKKEENFMSVRSTLSGGFPKEDLLFSPAEHMGVWPLAAVHTSLYQIICAEQQQSE